MKYLFTLFTWIQACCCSYSNNYVLLSSGAIELTLKTNDEYDLIIALDNGNMIRVPKGILDKRSVFTGERRDQNADLVPYQGEKIGASSNLSIMCSLFEFCAKNSEVEFGLSILCDTSRLDTFATLTTTFLRKENFGNGAVEVKKLRQDKNYVLVASIHNHPYFKEVDIAGPSGFYDDFSQYKITGDRHYYYQLLHGPGNYFYGRIPDKFHVYDVNSNRIYWYNHKYAGTTDYQSVCDIWSKY